MGRLYEQLDKYAEEDYYPFHMPGHKRQMKAEFCEDLFAIDITEIEGFDNLHHAEGVIAEVQDRAARLYGAQKTWMLVNGSTCGLLAAVSACTDFGGTLLMARNCHKAAYHAAYLRRLKVEYIFPEIVPEYGLQGGISVQSVKEKLERNPDIQAVLITSPTYDGMLSDMEAIAKVVHAHGIPLIVDEAHGAHLGFHPYFPESAVAQQADLVIQSLHKTMPALTQTALLHQNGDLVSADKIQRFLGIYQTSSPSYVLMASMDYCISMMEEKKDRLFAQYADALAQCRARLSKLQKLHFISDGLVGNYGIFQMDPSKLVIHTGRVNLDGPELYETLLDKYHLQMEMEAPEYILAMTSLADSKDGYERFCSACEEMDQQLVYEERVSVVREWKAPQIVLSIADAMERESLPMEYAACVDKISAEFIYLYPPGIPLAVPGEVLTRDILTEIGRYQEQNLKVQGPQDKNLDYLQIIAE